MQIDEESLVKRAQANDQQAFTQLYEAYFDKIYRYIVVRIGDRTEAEDMTQQVFLKALQSISSFKWKGAPFSAWLYRIAHNQVVDHLRKKSKRPVMPLDESLNVSNGKKESNPETMTEHSFNIEQLLAAASKLTEAQRQVISLRFTSELPTAQVAKIMGKSEGAIKALQHSAIQAMRRMIVVNANE